VNFLLRSFSDSAFYSGFQFLVEVARIHFSPFFSTMLVHPFPFDVTPSVLSLLLDVFLPSGYFSSF